MDLRYDLCYVFIAPVMKVLMFKTANRREKDELQTSLFIYTESKRIHLLGKKVIEIKIYYLYDRHSNFQYQTQMQTSVTMLIVD